jgi:hypothetical protein
MTKILYTQEELDKIIDINRYPDLANGGLNDTEGFQIFTPEFIVNDMIKLIGKDFVSDIYKTILEPTSGDGAFTVRILEFRLKKIAHDEKYLQKSLIALSTIFSIEMDELLIRKQRNNIFSLLIFSAKNYKYEVSNQYIIIAKNIILTNFIWGETNIERPLKFKGEAMGWYMPTTQNNKSKKIDKNRIQFAKWSITENINDSSCEFEDWEADITQTNFSDLGGLFSD